MLACIACVNKDEGGGGRDRDRDRDGGGDTPTCRDPVKSLTSQVTSTLLSSFSLYLVARSLQSMSPVYSTVVFHGGCQFLPRTAAGIDRSFFSFLAQASLRC
jgi:hypothetical protein